MAQSGTSTGTAASSPSSARFTVDSLATLLVNEFNISRNAAGGSVPDHVTRLVRMAGQYIWKFSDWRFRCKRGTLTTVASQESADLPSDFYELWQRWLRDPQTEANRIITFTEDPSRFQGFADRYDTTDSSDDSEPRLAVICQDTSQSSFTWYALLSPVPDDVYTYPFWYLTKDPWLTGDTADDAVPQWPQPFDDGWYMRAKYKLQSIHRGDDSWRELRGGFYKWINEMKSENDETISDAMERVEDWYSDLYFQPSTSGLETGFLGTKWPS